MDLRYRNFERQPLQLTREHDRDSDRLRVARARRPRAKARSLPTTARVAVEKVPMSLRELTLIDVREVLRRWTAGRADSDAVHRGGAGVRARLRVQSSPAPSPPAPRLLLRRAFPPGSVIVTTGGSMRVASGKGMCGPELHRTPGSVLDVRSDWLPSRLGRTACRTSAGELQRGSPQGAPRGEGRPKVARRRAIRAGLGRRVPAGRTRSCRSFGNCP